MVQNYCSNQNIGHKKLFPTSGNYSKMFYFEYLNIKLQISSNRGRCNVLPKYKHTKYATWASFSMIYWNFPFVEQFVEIQSCYKDVKTLHNLSDYIWVGGVYIVYLSEL